MRSLVLYVLLTLIASAGSAQEKKKGLDLTVHDHHFKPYVAPLLDRVDPFERTHISIDPQGSWRNRLFFGAKRSSGSAAKEVNSTIGIVPNTKQPFHLGINANLL